MARLLEPGVLAREVVVCGPWAPVQLHEDVVPDAELSTVELAMPQCNNYGHRIRWNPQTGNGPKMFMKASNCPTCVF